MPTETGHMAPLTRVHRLAVVCPTFGAGNWHRRGGVEAVVRAVRDASRRFDLDPQRLTLVALSNGGRGATRVVARHPDLFARVVLISPVLEQQPLMAGAAAWRDRPVLWIHGARDRRIPLRATSERVALIEKHGGRVVRRVYPEEDHFLLFSRRTELPGLVASWISRH